MSHAHRSEPKPHHDRGLWLILLVLLVLLGVVLLTRMHSVEGGVWVVRRSIGSDAISFLRDCAYRVERLCSRDSGCSRRGNTTSNMRQIVLCAIAYGVDSVPPSTWPLDLKAIQVYSDGDLPDRVFQDTRWANATHPFTYVRPSPTATSAQPVLLSRPTPGSNPKLIVAFADGHVSYVADTGIWFEARRLAALPKAREGGIEGNDWISLPELHHGAGSAPGAPSTHP